MSHLIRIYTVGKIQLPVLNSGALSAIVSTETIFTSSSEFICKTFGQHCHAHFADTVCSFAFEKPGKFCT